MSAHQQRPEAAFPWLSASKSFYVDAFGARSRKALAGAMAEFTALTPEERQFIQCHLQWLTVQALGSLRGQATMTANGIGDLLAAVDGAALQLEALFGEREPEEEEEELDVEAALEAAQPKDEPLNGELLIPEEES